MLDLNQRRPGSDMLGQGWRGNNAPGRADEYRNGNWTCRHRGKHRAGRAVVIGIGMMLRIGMRGIAGGMKLFRRPLRAHVLHHLVRVLCQPRRPEGEDRDQQQLECGSLHALESTGPIVNFAAHQIN